MREPWILLLVMAILFAVAVAVMVQTVMDAVASLSEVTP